MGPDLTVITDSLADIGSASGAIMVAAVSVLGVVILQVAVKVLLRFLRGDYIRNEFKRGGQFYFGQDD